MPPRTIDGPGESQWITTEQAWRWLGLGSDDTFHRLLRQFSWVRKRKIGSSTHYHWLDIFCLGHVMDRMEEIDTRDPDKSAPAAKKSDAAGDR